MKALKAGDRCQLQRGPCLGDDRRLTRRVGQTCEVVTLCDNALSQLMATASSGVHCYYRVRFADGRQEEVCQSLLKPLAADTPEPAGSWLRIEQISGWRPSPLPSSPPAMAAAPG